MKNELDPTGIRRRLDVVILLLLEISPRNAKTMASKIEFLLEMGLNNAEVAQIVGKGTSYVTATSSRKKKPDPKDRGRGGTDVQH